MALTVGKLIINSVYGFFSSLKYYVAIEANVIPFCLELILEISNLISDCYLFSILLICRFNKLKSISLWV